MREFFGLDSDFVRRPPDGAWRADLAWGALLGSTALLGWFVQLGLYQRLIEPGYTPHHWGWATFAVLVAVALLAVRRRHPLVVLVLLTAVHFVVVGETLDLLAIQAGLQVMYFLGLYTAMAWATHRELLMFGTGAVLLTMTVWIIIGFVTSGPLPEEATVPRPVAIAFQVVINIIYFGTAVWLGQLAWVQARDREELVSTRQLIEDQATELSEKAVLSERVRIARELHDSIAHQASLLGIQAAAARHALPRAPEQAPGLLETVEHTSRQMVEELRHIVGSLRDVDHVDAAVSDLSAIPPMLEEFASMGLQVDHEVVGDPDRVSNLQAATLTRIIQESLTNVRRHSSARYARVTLRIGDRNVEVEVVDDGTPVDGGQGNGVGQLGMRERIAALGGTIEFGPRTQVPGYRVLATIPLVERITK